VKTTIEELEVPHATYAFAYILYCAYLFAKQFASVIGMVATVVIFGVFLSSCIAFGVYVWRSFALSEKIAGAKTSRFPHSIFKA
jgi:hypothetical protein